MENTEIKYDRLHDIHIISVNHVDALRALSKLADEIIWLNGETADALEDYRYITRVLADYTSLSKSLIDFILYQCIEDIKYRKKQANLPIED